ncbi:dihydrofolate reductase family protein [Rhodococcus opacus]|uniref:dihydrofolate reductase family protein n=1 Tax=Rhodococcus opacus TaxID=37919 RepID=UPI001FF2AFA7|nr:dihydrofolate reductase family protein [Rhodococcus opacus]UOT04264.1 dihydrofolate reductase family protein [Rhodococcus opacus]
MRDLTYFVGITIDGFIAGPDGDIGFFPMLDDILGFMAQEYPETIPTHLREQFGVDGANKQFDTVIQGRATYEPALAVGITSPYAHLRQYVASRTLTESPDPAVEVVADPLEKVRKLKAENSALGVWVAGGGELAGTLLPEIDELVVKHYPVVAGRGTPMFGGTFQPTHFDVVHREVYPSGAAVSRFRRRV